MHSLLVSRVFRVDLSFSRPRGSQFGTTRFPGCLPLLSSFPMPLPASPETSSQTNCSSGIFIFRSDSARIQIEMGDSLYQWGIAVGHGHLGDSSQNLKTLHKSVAPSRACTVDYSLGPSDALGGPSSSKLIREPPHRGIENTGVGG